ncbi:MAG: Crp/Fnr family transcriptional regulator [Phaeovulum sp.]|uniref:Crp/Fnr family transcriptional regulator n=1 Tax=Phaeovulum sp. TaxID=2934796 RepID=UPI0027327CB6|nr:Crp/Fnr family transcriptional regulator [Phaeovulum sp.]MDP3861595.1 Crp/Fnr family transcriptional regulator [Phaeovulum sp.]
MTVPDQDLVLPAVLRYGGGRRVGQFFDTFTRTARAEIAAISSQRTILAGETVVAVGERSRYLGYVLDGILGMKKVLPDGRTHIIGLLTEADMFGRVLDGGSGFSVEALTDAEVFCIERQPFERILRQDPATERAFLVNVLDEIDAARDWVLLLGGRRVLERVASMLLLLVRHRSPQAEGGERGGHAPVPVDLPIRRADLAQYLGTRPESLSRAFHRLQSRGLIRLLDPFHFEILDYAALVEISGNDRFVASEHPRG